MDSVKADGEDNKELDDSGYVQDEGPQKPSAENGKTTNLLDLSDDVLLCILSFCRASDLKALGFSCTRLADLVRDRTLWQRVDARDRPYGRKRLRWLLDHALHAGTTHLYLKGCAEYCVGCEGYINGFRKEVQEKFGDLTDRPCTARQHRNWIGDPQNPLPRASASPSWPDEDPPRTEDTRPPSPTSCPGPHFTLTPCLLRRLQQQCNITHLQADLCNINCIATPLSLFPSTLTNLSLRGTRCFNVPNVQKSFLFQIQGHLPNLEFLDLSECSWLEPSCLLPLSKLPRLSSLLMTNCLRMTEFVAYASLAGRYGFKRLQVLDMRGSPIGDSEAAAFGWMPELRELYLSSFIAPGVAPASPRRARHQHYKDDALPHWQELCRWELDEPTYFRRILRQQRRKRAKADREEKCLHKLPYHKCTDGYCSGEENKNCSKNLKRKNSSDEPGPSKRRKSLQSSSDSDDYDDDEEMQDEDLNDDQSTNCENIVSEGNAEGGSATVNNEGNGEENGEVNNDIGEENNGGQGNEGEQPNVEQLEEIQQIDEHVFVIQGHIEALPNNQQQNNARRPNGGEQRNDDEPLEARVELDNDQPINGDQPNNGQPNNGQPNNGQLNNGEQPNNREGNNQGQENREGAAQNENVEARPRAQILYINLGRQNHPVFRAMIPNPEIPGPLSMEIRMPASHVPTHLITDSAIRSFGNSDDDNVNYFHIGGPPNPQNARPSKSNLRILSLQGYKKITDKSLMHLSTSAPKLEVIDFTETSVTERGVEKFKRRRPDVKVLYSRFVDREGPLDCSITLDG